MATMTIRHPVADYDSWRAVYDQADELRSKHGCTAARVLRDAEDPNTVLVLHDFPSVEAAQGFAEDAELRSAMERAGVAGPPRIELYEDAG